MEIPDLIPPDLGDLGSTPLDTPLPLDPLPARSSSPPLPPRKHASGLPPTYLHHLRALLHQWLHQQRATDSGQPGSDSPTRLWSDDRIVQIEQAIWHGVVVPDLEGGKRRLLDLEWAEWATGSARRKKAWREAQNAILSNDNEKTSRSSSMHEDRARGKLSLPPMSAVSATPKRISTRPPSIASTDKSVREGGRSPQPPTSKESEEDEEDRLREYLRVLVNLKGYQKCVNPYKEDWEVLEGGSHIPQLDDRELPGAFPQTAHLREPSAPDTPPFLPPKSGTSAPIDPADMVKVLFCVHFAPAWSMASASTVSLRRQTSIGQSSNGDSVGSANGRWWSGTASGRRWSSFGAGSSRDMAHPVEVNFVPQKFALPASSASTQSPKPARRSSVKRRPTTQDTTHKTDGLMDEADDTESDADSAWSGTQRPGSSSGHMVGRNAIISGGSNDIPLSQPEKDETCLVGGTVTVRGMPSEQERDAMINILQALLYTIQCMMYELELLDGFRIPREPDPLPVPPKTTIRQNSSPAPSRPHSPTIKRKASTRERGERAKGFFQRLGKDTRGVFDGLMGRSKQPDRTSYSAARENTVNPPETDVDMPSLITSETPTTSSQTPPTLSTDRHVQTLARLKSMLPSPTPALKIPMPPLLLRVRREENLLQEKAKQEVLSEEQTRSASGVIEGLSRLGSFSATGRETSGRVQARSYRVGGDVKAGLAVLMTQLDELAGWTKLQRLEILLCTGIDQKDVQGGGIICERPKPMSLVFWGEEDQTIEDVIEAFSDGENVCARPGCDFGQEDHVRWYFHNQQKIRMSVRRVESGMSQNGLDVWVKCNTCKRTKEPRRLSDMAMSFSWGKLLELIFYTNMLTPPDFCPHASERPSRMILNLRSPHTIISLSIQAVTVLDTRLPKLQVCPNVTKRKPGQLGAIGIANELMKKEAKDLTYDEVRKDATHVISAVRKNISETKSFYEGAAPSSTDLRDEQKLQQDRASAASALEDIEQSVIEAEAALWTYIETCPAGDINEARQRIIAFYECFTDKLAALRNNKDERSKDIDLPVYFDKAVHALPGSSILVREDEPSSIIAYTLSSVAYFAELASSNKNSERSDGDRRSDFSGWTIDVKRKDTPRDLLSLRAISKKRSDASMAKSEHRFPLAVAPNQPSLELSLDQVEGRSQTSDRLEDLVKSISRATAQDPVLTLGSKPRSPSVSESEVSISKRPPLSVNRRTSDSVKATPPSAFRPTRSVSSTGLATPVLQPSTSISGNTTPRSTTPSQELTKDGWSSVTSTFTNSFTSLMKMGSDMGSLRMRNTDRSLSALMGPLSMLSAMDNSLATSNMDDKPHLQFTYTLAERLSIGCTIYYATAFDSLRRRCAIDRSILDSLSRCESWNAQGGKSKASFFMTNDKRYIVKELVSKWNVSDSQALLDIAPSYFEHLASTHNKATSLAKIVAFASIKIQDMQSSTKKAMDLMVMENLFSKQNITKTYDLKGIGRKVPKAMADGTTLFDSEWIEGQSKTPILLYPHARRMLHEAIYNDTKYLCSQSIMDYSLLLGLDEKRHELVVGIVDAIGSYNLFKTIESRGKLALNRGGEVTIIPPDQYRERFETALKQYFIACPDKWSKTARRITSHALPAVF